MKTQIHTHCVVVVTLCIIHSLYYSTTSQQKDRTLDYLDMKALYKAIEYLLCRYQLDL